MLRGLTLLHLPRKPNEYQLRLVIFSLKTQTTPPKLFLILGLPIHWASKMVVVKKHACPPCLSMFREVWAQLWMLGAKPVAVHRKPEARFFSVAVLNTLFALYIWENLHQSKSLGFPLYNLLSDKNSVICKNGQIFKKLKLMNCLNSWIIQITF